MLGKEISTSNVQGFALCSLEAAGFEPESQLAAEDICLVVLFPFQITPDPDRMTLPVFQEIDILIAVLENMVMAWISRKLW